MKLFFSFLCVFVFEFCSLTQIRVKIKNAPLRTQPINSSKIKYSIPFDAQLIYLNDWQKGWVKVRYSTSQFSNKKPVDISGWISLNYIENNLFKSSILETLQLNEDSGCWQSIVSVDGIVVDFMREDYNVIINGVRYKLDSDDEITTRNYQKWEASSFKLEFFGTSTAVGIESSENQGVLRIEYNGKVEYIYACLESGC